MKHNRKVNVLLIIMFLCGVMIFLLPIFGQIQEVKEDDQEYAAMVEQFKPTHATEPVPLETDRDLVETTPTPVPTAMPDLLPDVLEVSPDPTGIPVSATEKPSAIPTDSPAATDVPRKPVTTQEPFDLEGCVAQNRDFVAWITIPGTPVNYPVVRSNNAEYYLHHLFNGKESKLGCLFSTKTSDYEAPSKNIAIYGHHLSASTAMFSSLMEYKDTGYWSKHSRITLETLYGTRSYRIFAVLNMKVSDWDPATASFVSDEEFMRFVERARKKALYDTDITVNADDNILTLITCDRSYGGASGRLIVMAVQE